MLEWSDSTLDKVRTLFGKRAMPYHDGLPWWVELPYQYRGVIHRTRQYTDEDAVQAACDASGLTKVDAGQLGSVQATCIAAHATLPQGWPFERKDRCELVAVLNSLYMNGDWPLVD
ncbi:MAG: hypothetical protein ACTS27_13350, partial [Phycisphaerales bacterium]